MSDKIYECLACGVELSEKQSWCDICKHISIRDAESFRGVVSAIAIVANLLLKELKEINHKLDSIGKIDEDHERWYK